MAQVTWLIVISSVCGFLVLQAQCQSPVTDEQVNRYLYDRNFVKKHVYCLVGRWKCDDIGNIIKSQAKFYLNGCGYVCPPDITRQLRRIISVVRRSYPREASIILQRYS